MNDELKMLAAAKNNCSSSTRHHAQNAGNFNREQNVNLKFIL